MISPVFLNSIICIKFDLKYKTRRFFNDNIDEKIGVIVNNFDTEQIEI